MQLSEHENETAVPDDRGPISTWDIGGGVLFLTLLGGFIGLMVLHTGFREFAWARHHNLLSWYIRPLMLIPFCFFAAQRSLTGMAFSMFALATSMMWFPEPTIGSELASEFLAMEVDYLSSDWTIPKILSMVLIPVFFAFLGIAFWKRKPIYGVLIIVIGTVYKMCWSVVQGDQSGYMLFPAAIFGVIVCAVVVVIGTRRNWF